MTGETLTVDDLAAWMSRFAGTIRFKREVLTDLDSAIGDADHGPNMDRGMQAVIGKLDSSPHDTVDTLFRTVGMALVGSVGGASGPLYGTFFLRFGGSAAGATELDAAALAAALQSGLDGVVARGKAAAGEKTMLDALAPAVTAFTSHIDDGPAAAARAAAEAAAAGRDATEPMTATKGRASYLGRRSSGHIDPGAASTAMLFDTLAAVADAGS